MEKNHGEEMMTLVKVDEGLFINPKFVTFLAKQSKMGHPLDQDPTLPNENIVKMATGDIFVIQQDIDELGVKLGGEE
jgi:hypothetical protein